DSTASNAPPKKDYTNARKIDRSGIANMAARKIDRSGIANMAAELAWDMTKRAAASLTWPLGRSIAAASPT
ncbi:hypothetical protein MY10362_009536, partial [Beauveria mimosiformis]